MIPVIKQGENKYKTIIPEQIQSIEHWSTEIRLGYNASYDTFNFDDYFFKIEMPSLNVELSYIGGNYECFIFTPKELLGINYETYIGSFLDNNFYIGNDVFNREIGKDVVFIIPNDTSIKWKENMDKLKSMYNELELQLEPVMKEHSDKLIKKIVSYIKPNDNFDYLI